MQPKMTAKDAAEFLNVSLQAVNKSLKTKELDFKKSANRIYFGHDTARSLFNLPVERKKIAFQIVKGGTGKTAITLNFALRASLYGLKVLAIDLDQQGNLTDLLGVDGDEYACLIDSVTDSRTRFKDLVISVAPGLHLVPSNLDNALLESTLTIKKIRLDKVISQKLKEVEDQYDVIVFDCPPALGSTNAAAALASDFVIAVVDPDRNALKGLKYTYEEIAKIGEDHDRKIPVHVALNKFDKRTSLSRDTLESLIKHKTFGPMFYKSYIGTSQQFPNVNAEGASIYDTIKDTTAKVDVDLLTREVLELEDALQMRRESEKTSKSAKEDELAQPTPAN